MAGIVDARLQRAFLDASPTTRMHFVAGCVERMADLFLGLPGSDPTREADVALFVQVLEELWQPSTEPAQGVDHTAAIDAFPEMSPEDEVVDPGEVAAALTIIVLRHATEFQTSGEATHAMECAHVALTYADLVDQNIPKLDWFAQESECQVRHLTAALDIEEHRALDRQVSRQRLALIRDA